MKANELRIGNWVKTEYKEIGNIKITEISESVIYSNKTKGISYRSLLPIPITEEILLKCGFEKYGNEDDGFRFYKDDYFIEYMCFKTDETSLCNLKYLHQLQNLYFALTGKELNVKL